jgi:hypothetical protein
MDKEKINYDRKSRAANCKLNDLVLLLDEAKKKELVISFVKDGKDLIKYWKSTILGMSLKSNLQIEMEKAFM